MRVLLVNEFVTVTVRDSVSHSVTENIKDEDGVALWDTCSLVLRVSSRVNVSALRVRLWWSDALAENVY